MKTWWCSTVTLLLLRLWYFKQGMSGKDITRHLGWCEPCWSVNSSAETWGLPRARALQQPQCTDCEINGPGCCPQSLSVFYHPCSGSDALLPNLSLPCRVLQEPGQPPTPSAWLISNCQPATRCRQVLLHPCPLIFPEGPDLLLYFHSYPYFSSRGAASPSSSLSCPQQRPAANA